eukprot:14027050-Alexandrium_andersonii.AAC.1
MARNRNRHLAADAAKNFAKPLPMLLPRPRVVSSGWPSSSRSKPHEPVELPPPRKLGHKGATPGRRA